jgi:hypothetical protein
MFRTAARLMQGPSAARLMKGPSAARLMKGSPSKRSAIAMPLSSGSSSAGGSFDSVFGVMVGSVFLTGIFAMYGGLTVFGRLTDRAGKAVANTVAPSHQAEQKLLRHAGVYADKFGNGYQLNPSQRL